MKAFRFVFCLLMLCASVLCACTRQKPALVEANAPRHFKELKAIEGLLESDPEMALDSVKALKEKAQKTSFTDADGNELRLREVQAQYKTRCLTEDSPDLSPVIAFYDSLTVLFPNDADLQYLLANTYYYKGVQLAFANDDVNAFSHYLKAMQVMRQREDWSATPYAPRFVALTYTRLSEILYRYGLADAALETCRKADSYYDSDSDHAAMMRFEAAIHQSKKDYDKALALFQEAEELVTTGSGAIELSVGAKLFDLQQYDSAVPHLEQAYLTGDRFARVDAASKLAEIYRDKGMDEEELLYTRSYVENSMLETRMSAKKMEIEYLYAEAQNAPTEEAENENNNAPWLIWILVLVAVIAFMAFIIVLNRKRISHIENKIVSIEQKHEQENAVKDLELEQMSQQLNATREQLEYAGKVDFDEAWKAFIESAIVQKIKRSVEGKDIMIKSVGAYQNLKLKEMDYIGLVQEANRCFPDFSSRFLKQYPDLNIADLRHCCLGLLGMNDAVIAVLEGISYSGANRRTNKILSSMSTGENLELAMITYLRNVF